MAALPPQAAELFSKQKPFFLATASKDGIPNVVPVGMFFVGEDGKLWLVDNYLCKTLKNIKENPWVAFDIWNPESPESYQVKGKAEIVSSGPDYEKAVAFAHSKKETFPAKNLIKVDPTCVYYTTPGDHAGKKLL
ncbi:MAG: pyridoxamine 5'-phosphate oxidase family protein [Candidatus Methanomethylophilaceae archaeon]|nr:pyridoxamine 5'-phosphate oxidase family protein [Candidatus Methanomethylophilaceae archaeon]